MNTSFLCRLNQSLKCIIIVIPLAEILIEGKEGLERIPLILLELERRLD